MVREFAKCVWRGEKGGGGWRYDGTGTQNMKTKSRNEGI